MFHAIFSEIIDRGERQHHLHLSCKNSLFKKQKDKKWLQIISFHTSITQTENIPPFHDTQTKNVCFTNNIISTSLRSHSTSREESIRIIALETESERESQSHFAHSANTHSSWSLGRYRNQTSSILVPESTRMCRVEGFGVSDRPVF